MYCSQEDDCGYDVQSIQEVPDTLMCILCHLVLRDPVQIMACGHRFCSACFDRMKMYAVRMNSDLCCPIDRKVIDAEKVFKDTGIARDIADLKVKCSNNENGCDWEGELRNLKDHLDICEAKDNSGIQGKMDEETSKLFTQVFQRISKCERDMLKKDKEIACMKLNLHEIKNENIHKNVELLELGKEMKSLKEKNCQYEEEIKRLKEENTKQSEELNDVKGMVNILTEQIFERKNNMVANTKENEDLLVLKEHLYDTNRFIHARVRNIENFLFYTAAIGPNTTVYKWKLRHYRYFSNNKTDMNTANFEARPTKYQCYFGITWSGENEKNVSLTFTLCKGLMPAKENLFSMWISFDIIDRDGNKVNRTITPDMIDANRERYFTVYDGEEYSRNKYVFPNVLTLPNDKHYIINNTLTIQCSLTSAT